MSLENKLTNCPLCKCTLNDTVNRLIKEVCGHLKCRACLLIETNGCQLCYELKKANSTTTSIDTVVCIPSEDQNITYQITGNFTASDDADSVSDKLQIDTDSDSSTKDLDIQTKPPLANNKIYNNKTKTAKISRRGKSLYSHILTKSKDDGNYFECSICKKTFTSRGHRHYHLFCNNIDKPLKCEICNKEFITKFHYNYHLETHQKNITFKCPKCDRSYLRSNSLRKHLQKHSIQLKHFTCTECGARFQSSSLLKVHENKHKNIFPFKCDKCDRKFTLKSNLQNHLVVHLKEKKFICDLCGKQFARKGSLKLHSTSHSDERPYKCKYCNKTFTHQRIYSRHLSIHLNNKTFNCPFCEAKCSRKDNFYRHLRNLHPNSNYKENNKNSTESSNLIINNSDSSEKCQLLNPEKETLADDNTPVCNSENNPKQIKFRESIGTIPNSSISDGPNSVNVIQSVGNAKPIKIPSLLNLIEIPTSGLPEYRSEIAKEICEITNQMNSAPTKRCINVIKPKKPYDPIEIYRKILMPNEHDEEEEDGEGKINDINANSYNKINQKEEDITHDILQKAPPIDFSEIHWRKRTSKYFLMK